MKSAWGRKEIKKKRGARERERKNSHHRKLPLLKQQLERRDYTVSLSRPKGLFFFHTERERKKKIYILVRDRCCRPLLLLPGFGHSTSFPVSLYSSYGFFFFIRPLFFFLLENGKRRKRRNFFLWRPNQVCACINSSWKRGRKGTEELVLRFRADDCEHSYNLPAFSQGSWHNKLSTGARYSGYVISMHLST